MGLAYGLVFRCGLKILYDKGCLELESRCNVCFVNFWFVEREKDSELLWDLLWFFGCIEFG